jgi:hypothetical protein
MSDDGKMIPRRLHSDTMSSMSGRGGDCCCCCRSWSLLLLSLLLLLLSDGAAVPSVVVVGVEYIAETDLPPAPPRTLLQDDGTRTVGRPKRWPWYIDEEGAAMMARRRRAVAAVEDEENANARIRVFRGCDEEWKKIVVIITIILVTTVNDDADNVNESFI